MAFLGTEYAHDTHTYMQAKHPHTKNKSKQTNKRPASYDFNQEFRREISGLTGRQHHGDWKAFLGRGTASLVGMH